MDLNSLFKVSGSSLFLNLKLVFLVPFVYHIPTALGKREIQLTYVDRFRPINSILDKFSFVLAQVSSI